MQMTVVASSESSGSGAVQWHVRRVAAGLGLFMLTVIGLGLLVSLASHTRQQAQQTMFIMLPMMLLSGFIFPIESMPAALVPVTYAMPLTWAVLLLRGPSSKASASARSSRAVGAGALRRW